MHRLRKISVLGVIVLVAGCYHATFDTGLEPSNRVIEQTFAISLIYGLVPPPTVYTAERCPNGVAKIETELSFLNMLVQGITFGIFSPMHLKVTCAMGGGMGAADGEADVVVGNGAALEEKQQALKNAAELSAKRRAPVLIRFF